MAHFTGKSGISNSGYLLNETTSFYSTGIDRLVKRYLSPLSINYKTPIEQIMYCSGQQSVIDYLQAVLNNSNNESLNKQTRSIE